MARVPKKATTAAMTTSGVQVRPAKVAPMTIVINQSPWFDSFRKTVELYEKETGNKVELDVNPFAGSLDYEATSKDLQRVVRDLTPCVGHAESRKVGGGSEMIHHDGKEKLP